MSRRVLWSSYRQVLATVQQHGNAKGAPHETPQSIVAAAHDNPPLYDAYSRAYVYLGSGMDHMAAIVAVLGSNPLPYLSSYTLNRAVLEAAARSHWLTEEGIGTGTRIARSLLDRMDSIWSESLLVPPGDSDFDEMQAHVLARTDAILREARKAHLNVSTYGKEHSRRGQPQQLARERRPGPTKAVDTVLQWVYGNDQRWFYSHLSGFVHSSIYAIVQGTEVLEDRGGIKTLRANVNMVQLSTTTIACAYCHAMVLHLLSAAAGYPDSPESPLETVIATHP